MQGPTVAAASPVDLAAETMSPVIRQSSAGSQPINPPIIVRDSSTPLYPADGNDAPSIFPLAIAIQGQTLTDGAAPVDMARKSVLFEADSLRVGSEFRPRDLDDMLGPQGPASRFAVVPTSNGPPTDPRPVGALTLDLLSLPDPPIPAPVPVDPTLDLWMTSSISTEHSKCSGSFCSFVHNQSWEWEPGARSRSRWCFC